MWYEYDGGHHMIVNKGVGMPENKSKVVENEQRSGYSRKGL